MKETDLTLEIVGRGSSLPPFSARECTQTLTPLPQGSLRRSINGTLIWIGNKGYQKYRSTISCKDKACPSLDGVWKGTLLRVGCLQTLTQTILKDTLQLQLEREPTSFYIYDKNGKLWPGEKRDSRWLALSPKFSGGFITYHPLLMMIVKDYTLETDEWGLSVRWTLELEEE
ncbi:MAG: hypothetical protein JSR85_06510 [Proteobacteria bacterium]|nr:hypothetical protein [Pseudomonadota bacterium]